MSKSRRKRRTGGRATPSPKSPVIKLLSQNHQAHGALGVINFVAHVASLSDTEGPPTLESGRAFVNLVAVERHRLAAAALAVVAEVWPIEEVRQKAQDEVAARSNQLSGVVRDLDQTHVSAVWRLTDEYRDSEVLLIELDIGGRRPATLAAMTDRFQRSWVELAVYDSDAEQAAEKFEQVATTSGGPRRIFEQVDLEDSRVEIWLLTACRNVEGEDSAPMFLRWIARLLDVDVEFPAIPKFNREASDDAELDVSIELDEFLTTRSGRAWTGEQFDGLIDQLSQYEWGSAAMRWSPARVEDFLLFSDRSSFEGQALAIPALLRGWVTHCAGVVRQRKPLLLAVLAEIDRCEPEFFADAA